MPEKFIHSREDFDRAGLRFFGAASADQLSSFTTGLMCNESASLRASFSVRSHAHSIHVGVGLDSNGRIAGHDGNCVNIVLRLTGEHVIGNGKDIMGALQRTGRWAPSGPSGAGTVCSWVGGVGG